MHKILIPLIAIAAFAGGAAIGNGSSTSGTQSVGISQVGNVASPVISGTAPSLAVQGAANVALAQIQASLASPPVMGALGLQQATPTYGTAQVQALQSAYLGGQISLTPSQLGSIGLSPNMPSNLTIGTMAGGGLSPRQLFLQGS